MYPYICEAVETYQEQTSDEHVHTYEFATNLNSVENGIAAGHPSARVHRMMAEELVSQMRSVLGW